MRTIGLKRNPVNHRIAQELVRNSNDEYWDILLDIDRPGLYDMYREMVRTKFPSVNIIESMNPHCAVLIQYMPPEYFHKYKGQLFCVYVANDLLSLANLFNELQYQEFNGFKKKIYMSYYQMAKSVYNNTQINPWI